MYTYIQMKLSVCISTIGFKYLGRIHYCAADDSVCDSIDGCAIEGEDDRWAVIHMFMYRDTSVFTSDIYAHVYQICVYLLSTNWF
jgi:hypothetical protein